jgi:hypothetical protein
MSEDLKAAAQREGSFGQTAKAIAWAFFGVRKSSGHREDLARLNPVHVLIAGVIGAVLFVLALVVVVQWVTTSGIPQA